MPHLDSAALIILDSKRTLYIVLRFNLISVKVIVLSLVSH